MTEKNLQQILGQSRNFQALLKKTNFLQSLNITVKNLLPMKLKDQCEVLDYEQNCLVLAVTNAAVATHIRYESAELLMKLRTEGKLPALGIIKCRIQKDMPSIPTESTFQRTLSKSSAEHLQAAAKSIDDEGLAKALLALSSRAESA